MIKSFYSGLVKPADDPNSEGASKQSHPSGKFVLRLLISVGILFFLISWLKPETLVRTILSVPASVWLLVFLLFLTGHIASALKWRFMLGATGITIRSGLSVQAHFAGLFANLFLPSIVGGDFIRAALVVREQKGEMAAIALGSLADRLNDIIALVLIASVGSLLLPSVQETVFGDALTILALILLLGLVATVVIVRVTPKSIVPEMLRNVFDKILLALDSLISNPLTAVSCLILSLLIQGGFVGLNLILAEAMGIEASIMLWMFAWPMAKLIALAPISLGGIGVREVALAGILAPFGVDVGLAVAQSLSWEVILIVTGLLSGIAVAMVPSRTTSLE